MRLLLDTCAVIDLLTDPENLITRGQSPCELDRMNEWLCRIEERIDRHPRLAEWYTWLFINTLGLTRPKETFVVFFLLLLIIIFLIVYLILLIF